MGGNTTLNIIMRPLTNLSEKVRGEESDSHLKCKIGKWKRKRIFLL